MSKRELREARKRIEELEQSIAEKEANWRATFDMKDAEADALRTTLFQLRNQPATKTQRELIDTLADERGTVAPSYTLTAANADKVIAELQSGTYNPDSWAVPFA